MKERWFKFSRSKSRTCKPSKSKKKIRNKSRTRPLQESKISTLKWLCKTHWLMAKTTMVTSNRRNRRLILYWNKRKSMTRKMRSLESTLVNTTR